MRRFLPQTLPVWVLLIVIAGLLISQVATLYIVSRDRAAANDVVDLYRLNDRAFSLVQLMHDATPEERKATASGLFNATYALTVSDTPAGDDELAELEDILVGRLSKFGITDARVRRDPASREADAPGGTVPNKEVGQVERDLLVLAADFAQSDKLTASL
ncbi:MAG: osmolarity sensor protein EnvZ, partial [Mesorhizobium sp.]